MKKSQAAVEFLVTYGWAILASLIAIGALAYFGFGTSTVLPDKCLISNSFDCKDYLITATPPLVQLKIVNGLGQTIYNPSVNVSSSGVTYGCTLDIPGDWVPDDIREASCAISGAVFVVKDKTKLQITVNYRKTPTGYTQIASGELYAAVQ